MEPVNRSVKVTPQCQEGDRGLAVHFGLWSLNLQTKVMSEFLTPCLLTERRTGNTVYPPLPGRDNSKLRTVNRAR